ncbi:HNH endonuclease [Leucobacter sp. CSA1]|uniref:HNH endonuclease n=1 Tax=Leucobacter chromiisoli TaxID=2796471 RepID=A0A934UU87_9MICO|nr:HNH endonuclease signature motif containing protein [Leucobacter chromiisoli]MBK0418161.1 HNH endonuclease [Leucobacter chromiisoli]
MGIIEAGLVVEGGRMRRAYEAEILRYAEGESPNRTRRMAKVLAEKHAYRTFEERHASARDRRAVSVTDLDDGMAELRAIMDATSAHTIYDRLCRQARVVQDAERATAAEARTRAAAGRPGEVPGVRPLDGIRADLAADILLNGVPSNGAGEIDLSGIRARVQVTVPVLSLLRDADTAEDVDSAAGADAAGADAVDAGAVADAAAAGAAAAGGADNPGGARRYLGIAGLQGAAALAGHGPIDAATARLLAGLQAGWDRISCDPVTGDVLSVDRYRPSAEIARFIAARDMQCRFMGCNVVAHRADRDHTLDAALGGATSISNLAILCRRHHVMKHHTGFTVEQSARGMLEWVSALGSRCRDAPVSRVMFRPIGSPEPDRHEEEGRRPAPSARRDEPRHPSPGTALRPPALRSLAPPY